MPKTVAVPILVPAQDVRDAGVGINSISAVAARNYATLATVPVSYEVVKGDATATEENAREALFNASENDDDLEAVARAFGRPVVIGGFDTALTRRGMVIAYEFTAKKGGGETVRFFIAGGKPTGSRPGRTSTPGRKLGGFLGR